MYRIFSAWMERNEDDRAEAVHIARLNACGVQDIETGEIIADYRTPESETDEKG